MPQREQTKKSSDPRAAAVKHVTQNGKHTLTVNEFIPASRPSGGDLQYSGVTGRASGKYAPSVKGVKGVVNETGQSFTMRDDFDFKGEGKGYHVNTQLGKETTAFCSGRDSSTEYYNRVDMTGERLYYDGHKEAAKFYTKGHSR